MLKRIGIDWTSKQKRHITLCYLFTIGFYFYIVTKGMIPIYFLVLLCIPIIVGCCTTVSMIFDTLVSGAFAFTLSCAIYAQMMRIAGLSDIKFSIFCISAMFMCISFVAFNGMVVINDKQMSEYEEKEIYEGPDFQNVMYRARSLRNHIENLNFIKGICIFICFVAGFYSTQEVFIRKAVVLYTVAEVIISIIMKLHINNKINDIEAKILKRITNGQQGKVTERTTNVDGDND